MLYTASQSRELPATTSHDLKQSWEMGSGDVSCRRSHPVPRTAARPHLTPLLPCTGTQDTSSHRDGQPATSATHSILTTAAPWLYQPRLHTALLGCWGSGTLGLSVRAEHQRPSLSSTTRPALITRLVSPASI